MTPAARHAAAIDLLDRILAGEAAERALTNWGRAARYAGSKDRAAVRDLVFDALRCRRSFGRLGGGDTGRGLILGGMRDRGQDPAEVFTGEGHAPAPLSGPELLPPAPMPELVALDCPEALSGLLRDSLGDDFAPVMRALRARAPVHLRVNLARASRDAVRSELEACGIATVAHPLSPAALEVTANARAVQASAAYQEGRVEVQDAASQAVADGLPVAPGARVLDFCAGGGGKTLAMAGRVPAQYTAHDADPARMRDLPARAARAGITVRLTDRPAGAWDLVLCDAPCSGTGAWRRSPEAKWRTTRDFLARLTAVQDAILDRAAGLVAPGGVLAYATCSLLRIENEDRVAAFLGRHPDWSCLHRRRLTPLDGGDGFFVAHLTRAG